MKTKTFSVTIHAPKEKVWYSLSDDDTYRDWTRAFSEGSYAVSDWQEGSFIHFMDPEGNGMHSRITALKPFETITFHHITDIKNRKVVPESDWPEGDEKYTFTEKDGNTTVTATLEAPESMEAFFDSVFPKALQRLKEIAEDDQIKSITVRTSLRRPLEKVWDCFTKPEHIVNWNFASEDWYCPKVTNELKTGGHFSFTMASRDETTSFDFEGVYTEVVPLKLFSYTMADGRKATVRFDTLEDTVIVTEIFQPESHNPLDLQRAGWQSILDNFKKYTEQLG